MPAGGFQTGWEQLFWLVFERSSNAIFMLDEQRRVVELNGPASELLGRSRTEAVGRSIVDSIREPERQRSEREWRSFLHSGEYKGTRFLVRADGVERQVGFAARLAFIGGRRLAIYVVLMNDTTTDPKRAGSSGAALTNRERQVVTQIALGRSTNEIGEQLHISPETVRTHVRNAMSKLGARTRAQLVAIVLCTEGAVHPPDLQD
jgi:PAS domain S-box-containing protein